MSSDDLKNVHFQGEFLSHLKQQKTLQLNVGKLLNFSKHLFPHQLKKKGDKSTFLT